MKRTSFALVGMAFVVACSGKTLLVGTNDAGSTAGDRDGSGATDVDGSGPDADGPADGGPASSDPWYCLDLPPEVLSASDQVAVTLTIFNTLDPISYGSSDLTASTYVAVPGITVEACQGLLGACASPNSGMGLSPGPAITDDAGQATVVVQQNFDGYIQYTGEGFLPSTLSMGNLLPDASTFSPPLPILATNGASGLSVELGVLIEGEDAGVGMAFFSVYDCFDNRQTGVAFSVNPIPGAGSVSWYARGVASLPSSAATVTDENGAGGIVNVPAGELTVTATLASTQRIIGTNTVLIQPGWATTAWIRARSH